MFKTARKISEAKARNPTIKQNGINLGYWDEYPSSEIAKAIPIKFKRQVAPRLNTAA
jgi:hypothetical protein